MFKNEEIPTRWDALKSILLFPEKRKAIGPAWTLYFYLIFQMDSKNKLVTNYQKLKEDLEEGIPTIKKWKERLIKERIIINQQINHGIAISLLPPYDAPAIAIRDDIVELKLRSDPKTRNLLKMALSSDYLALLPILSDLAQRMEHLEKTRLSEP